MIPRHLDTSSRLHDDIRLENTRQNRLTSLWGTSINGPLLLPDFARFSRVLRYSRDSFESVTIMQKTHLELLGRFLLAFWGDFVGGWRKPFISSSPTPDEDGSKMVPTIIVWVNYYVPISRIFQTSPGKFHKGKSKAPKSQRVAWNKQRNWSKGRLTSFFKLIF